MSHGRSGRLAASGPTTNTAGVEAEFPLDRADVTTILEALFDLKVDVSRILDLLEEDDDGEEEEEGPDS